MAYDLKGTEEYIRQAARRRGIDPDTAVRVARSEGLAPGVYQSNLSKGGRREPSYGPFQLLVGGEGTNYPAGLGNDFRQRTGLDPSDPSTVNAQVDFALDHAAQNGWSAWYGAKAAGIGNRQGIGGAGGGGAADAVTQMGGGGRAPGADDALVSAYADRGPTGVKVEGPSTQAAGPEASPAAAVPKLQSTDLEDAMMQRAMKDGSEARNAYDVIGDLAQVWAASSAKKDKEAKNETTLSQAMKSAGLDPDVAALAQLGGDRESLVNAVSLQNQRRTQADARADRQDERTYQRGRDTVADERYAAERDYRSGRDAKADERADRKAEPYRALSADEAKQMGLPEGQSYQLGPDNQVHPIAAPKQGGSGLSITSPDGTTIQMGGGVKVPSNFMPDPANPGAVKPIPGGPGEQLPSELAARIGLADNFLKQAPGLRERLSAGDVTGPADRFMAGNNQASPQAGVYRQLESGTDALMRMLTGAGMNQTEAEAYARRYLPTYTDDAASAAGKLDQLTGELTSAKEQALKGRGGPPSTVTPQAPGAGAVDYRSKYGLE